MSAAAKLYLERVRELTLCEWKLREQSSVFGFLWTLLQPLILFVALHALFTKWMGARTDRYAFHLLIGIVQYGFFASATSVALNSLIRRRGIVLNFRVDRDALVLAAALSVALSHLIELALMLAFMLALGAAPSASWLCLPVVVLVQAVLVVGLGFWLAPLAARCHDLERAWAVALNVGFFLTPVFYDLSVIDPSRRRLLLLNPMTRILETTRGCLLRGEFPEPAAFAALASGCLVLAVAGWAFFRGRAAGLADEVAV